MLKKCKKFSVEKIKKPASNLNYKEKNYQFLRVKISKNAKC